MGKRILLLGPLAFLLTQSKLAWACSSCGSGGADPVILNPSEQRKFYLGLNHQNSFQDIDLRGQVRASYGPQTKTQMEVAWAERLRPQLFGSIVLGYAYNRRAPDTASGLGDGTINLRYTVWQPSMLEPWLPQLQFMVSHRFGLGRSVYESKREHYLDVFGAGFDETSLGFDSWWGMNALVGGVSFIYSQPWEENTEAGAIRVGAAQKLIVSVGAMPWPECKLLTGMVREQRLATRLDGEAQAESDRLAGDAFFSAETLIPEGDNVRLIVSRKAALGRLKNTSRAWSYTLAWMRTL